MAEATHRRSSRSAVLWVGAALVVIAAFVAGVIVDHVVSSNPEVTTSVCNATSVADETVPSVVTIEVMRNGREVGTGSGEFFRTGGYILTNNHVIAPAVGGNGTIEVVMSDGQRVGANLVGRDPLTDLAVLRASDASSPKVIELGSSSQLDVGQPVVVVGAPLGLSSTVTTGIVSALARTIQVPGETSSSSAVLADAIQTDAAINPGNSGGAMVNCRGQLVGVPTAGAVVPGSSGGGSIGLGFAIPIDVAETVADEIISTGSVTHASFGMQAVPISASAAQRAGVSSGLRVTAVQNGGPADSAGVRAGDVITKIDGKPAESVDQLVSLTITKRPGDKVDLTIERNGRTEEVAVELGAQSS